MSRVAKNPVTIPAGLDVNVSGQTVTVKGAKGSLHLNVHDSVSVGREDNVIKVAPRHNSIASSALAGTMRALINNLVIGVGAGFSKKLDLVGVGYRAQTQGQALNLTLGFSHPVVFKIPQGITIETPSQTEIVVKGMDKQQVGQVAAVIRSYRPVEPYKGKGVRYSDEVVIRKEVKKK
ncbi:MAG: 50S ribosomal protein L6 [Gammaproteobacteria bacterium]